MSARRVCTKSNPAFRNCNRGEEKRQCNRATAVFILPSEKCELQVDRADSKGFVLLAIDTTPGLHRHPTLPERPGEVDLPGHLPRRRQPRRPMEQPRQHRRGV